MIWDGEHRRTRTEVSVGFGPEGESARVRLHESILGRVVASGRPVVVSEASRDPLMRRPATRHQRSGAAIVCVPILLHDKPVGAVAVETDWDESRDSNGSQRFLSVIASMITHTLSARRMVEDERTRLLEENGQLSAELREPFELPDVVGTSGPMRRACALVAQVASTDSPVLIRGEPGTGKELIARAIHLGSCRAQRPFLKVDLAARPDALFGPELLGNGNGAFAGALRSRLDLARGGTLFLDEVGNLSPANQAKLLQLLQENELEGRWGGQPIKDDVRVLAATNRDLETALAARDFREDLYERLGASTIFLPALRDRKPDITLIADHLLARFSRQYGKSVRRITARAVDLLMSHDWPGNVRELENAIAHAVATCERDVIHGHHLPSHLQPAGLPGTANGCSLSGAVERYELDLILDALKTARGNNARAARLLATTGRVIGCRIRKYQIDATRFRARARSRVRRPADDPG